MGQQALVDIYSKAQNDLYNTIATKTAKGNSVAYQRALLGQVNEILKKLQTDSTEWSRAEIPNVYDSGMTASQADTAKRYALSNKEYSGLQRLSQAKFAKLNTGAIDALVDSNIGKSSVANAGLAKNLNNTIKQKFTQGLTAKETQKILVEEIFGVNGTGKLEINGRKYDSTKYADMFSRAATKEAQNTAAYNESESVGSDTIGMSGHGGACEICDPLQDRWYSKGKGKYPDIFKTAWKNGHKLPHPRCEHSFFTIILELEDNETINAQLKKAKAPTDPLPRTDKRLKAYYDDQKAKAKLWSDKQQYERYVARLGDEAPKSFSGFRRMKKANDQNWVDLESEYGNMGRYIKNLGSEG